MAEYIEREAALNVCEMHYQHCLMMHDYSGDATADNIKTDIETIPAADVVEVRHERFEWGYQNGQYGIWCTNCGTGWVNSEIAEWIAHEHDYCPNCGAKMDGKGEGE